jgi:phage terminase large subunit-like protein
LRARRAAPHLYAQGKIKHARPFPMLENQLCNHESGSPDRADALIWAPTELSAGSRFRFVGIFG